jgi:hypothetical protein
MTTYQPRPLPRFGRGVKDIRKVSGCEDVYVNFTLQYLSDRKRRPQSSSHSMATASGSGILPSFAVGIAAGPTSEQCGTGTYVRSEIVKLECHFKLVPQILSSTPRLH